MPEYKFSLVNEVVNPQALAQQAQGIAQVQTETEKLIAANQKRMELEKQAEKERADYDARDLKGAQEAVKTFEQMVKDTPEMKLETPVELSEKALAEARKKLDETGTFTDDTEARRKAAADYQKALQVRNTNKSLAEQDAANDYIADDRSGSDETKGKAGRKEGAEGMGGGDYHSVLDKIEANTRKSGDGGKSGGKGGKDKGDSGGDEGDSDKEDKKDKDEKTGGGGGKGAGKNIKGRPGGEAGKGGKDKGDGLDTRGKLSKYADDRLKSDMAKAKREFKDAPESRGKALKKAQADYDDRMAGLDDAVKRHDTPREHSRHVGDNDGLTTSARAGRRAGQKVEGRAPSRRVGDSDGAVTGHHGGKGRHMSREEYGKQGGPINIRGYLPFKADGTMGKLKPSSRPASHGTDDPEKRIRENGERYENAKNVAEEKAFKEGGNAGLDRLHMGWSKIQQMQQQAHMEQMQKMSGIVDQMAGKVGALKDPFDAMNEGQRVLRGRQQRRIKMEAGQ